MREFEGCLSGFLGFFRACSVMCMVFRGYLGRLLWFFGVLLGVFVGFIGVYVVFQLCFCKGIVFFSRKSLILTTFWQKSSQ